MTSNRKIRYRHLHEYDDEGNKGQLVGTIAMFVDNHSRFAALGYSLVNPTDTGSRKEGRSLANARLVENIEDAEEHGNVPFGINIDTLMHMEDYAVREMCHAHLRALKARDHAEESEVMSYMDLRPGDRFLYLKKEYVKTNRANLAVGKGGVALTMMSADQVIKLKPSS